MNNVRPKLRLLNQEQILQIHQYALHILSKTGVRVDSPSTIECLNSTRLVQVQGKNVKFHPALIEEAIQSAPKTIQIYDRIGNPAFLLGNDRLRFGVGVTALYFLEPTNDRLEPFTRHHMRIMTRLGGNLPNYDVISTPGIVQDVPTAQADLYGNLEMFANTTKPLVVLTSDKDTFTQLLDIYEQLHGDLSKKPFIIPYFNPVSPLVMNEKTLVNMDTAIERRLPFIFSNYSLAGASTPITPAGTLALLLAELLAGLTISQVRKPGTPVSLGMLPIYFDMKATLNIYDPQSILLNIACAEIMDHYHLPHCGTSGSGMGWGMDLIAVDSYWMNTLSFALTKGGLAPFIGDTLASKAISPCAVVNMNEIIEQALRFANGFQLDEAEVALDEIDTAAPGGNFLSSPTTLKNYRSGYYTNPLYPRWTMEKWQSEGRPDAQQLLREKTKSMISELTEPEDYQYLLGKGEELIKNLRKNSL